MCEFSSQYRHIVSIQLSVITPERTVYDGQVDQVTLRTAEGEITVLPNHIPYVSTVEPGELRIVQQGKVIPMAVAGGFVEVLPENRIAILADEALRVEDLDLTAIEAARERARKALTETRHADDASFAAAAAALEKELARARIARKYHRGHGIPAPGDSPIIEDE